MMEGHKTDVTLEEARRICREKEAYFTPLAWREDPMKPGLAINAMEILRALRSALEHWEHLVSHRCPKGKE